VWKRFHNDFRTPEPRLELEVFFFGWAFGRGLVGRGVRGKLDHDSVELRVHLAVSLPQGLDLATERFEACLLGENLLLKLRRLRG